VQLDAGAALGALRADYEREVNALFDRIGLGGDAALDRRVALAVWEMAPPGVDEIAALIGILDASAGEETVVVDTAPTGHFLHLVAMPSLALDWTHALMRVLLKYRAADTLDTLSERILALARQLRALQVTLTTADRAGVFMVTLDEPMVRAETARLAAALGDAGVGVPALIVNRAGAPGTDAAASPVGTDAATGTAGTARGAERGRAGWAPDAGTRVIVAPDAEAGPVGAVALERFLERWEFAR
jgi:arsenite/tail-anchored protein-transporting ATPase